MHLKSPPPAQQTSKFSPCLHTARRNSITQSQLKLTPEVAVTWPHVFPLVLSWSFSRCSRGYIRCLVAPEVQPLAPCGLQARGAGAVRTGRPGNDLDVVPLFTRVLIQAPKFECWQSRMFGVCCDTVLGRRWLSLAGTSSCVCVSFFPLFFLKHISIQGLLCSCETEITYFHMLGLLVHSQPCPGEGTEPELGQGVQRELLRGEVPSPQHRQTNRRTKFSSDQAGPPLPSTGFSGLPGKESRPLCLEEAECPSCLKT